MKSCSIILILLTLLSTSAVCQENQSVTLKGKISDYKSKMPLASQIKIIYTDSQLNTQESNTKGDGSFELKVFQKNFILQAKAEGYIVSNVVMNLEAPAIPSIVQAQVPMIIDGKFKNNQFIVDFTQRNQSDNASKEPFNRQVFQAIDATDGSIIGAKFRLIGSNRNEIVNTETSVEESVFEHDFTKKDNLLLEVTAKGYQKFLGNIVIDNLDNNTNRYIVKLIKSVSFLNLIIIHNKINLQSIAIIDNTTKKAIQLSENGNVYFGMLDINKKYTVKINTTETGEIIRELVATEGVNQLLIKLEPKVQNQVNFTDENISLSAQTKVVTMEKQAFTTEKKTVSLENKTLFFDQSSYVLKPEAKQVLEEISKQLLDSPNINIEITGYADNVGDVRQNQYLSEFRAKVISSFLFNKGINDKRIKLKGDGGKQADSDTEEARQRNRRVELRFY